MKFINYYGESHRSTALNVGVARVLVGLYGIWKFGTQIEWSTLQVFPGGVAEFTAFLVLPGRFNWLLAVEFWLTLAMLVLFTVGYRVGLAGFLAAVMIAHLSGAAYSIANSGTTETFIPLSFALMIFAVFRENDLVSIDHYRRLRSETIGVLNSRLRDRSDRQYDMAPLKLLLVVVALFYFFTGLSKIRQGSIVEWMTAESINRYMQVAVLRGYDSQFVDLLVSNPLLAWVSAVTSVILELGFVVVVLAGFGISIWVIFFFGFHTGIALTLTPFFFDQYLILLLFFSWDSLHTRLTKQTRVDVVYDDRCHFCARVLLILDHFDPNNVIRYHPLSDPPEEVYDEHDFREEMYVFSESRHYRGYHAFRHLFSHLGFLRPVAALMNVSPVAKMGEKMYGHIAANRSRYAYCNTTAKE